MKGRNRFARESGVRRVALTMGKLAFSATPGATFLWGSGVSEGSKDYGNTGAEVDGMNEDRFNSTIRKFLKEVGVTSQREIEKAVREALGAGRLQGGEKLEAKMTLEVGRLGLVHEIDGHIDLG